MQRRKFLSLLAGGLAGAAALAARARPARAEGQKPHILYLVADDLGWNNIGWHSQAARMPHLDTLAASGVKLEQFYVQPLCTPTRSSLMTGRYPMRQGLQCGVIRPEHRYGLPLNERLLPQGLKSAGYATAICGKWHLGHFEKEYLPHARGFDHHYGNYFGQIDYFTHERMGKVDWHRDGETVEEEGYVTELIGREAVKIVERHDPGRPLFLYVPFTAVHAPLQVPKEYLERVQHVPEGSHRTYAAMVACMDDQVGNILDAFGRRGMRERTLVVFHSDNGGPTKNGANNHPLRGEKNTLYEGGVRVPACLSWTGQIKPGTTYGGMLHATDMYPTLLKLAGASLEQPLPLDGMDAWPAIAEGKPSPRTEFLVNIEPDRGALRLGDWKLIRKNPKKGQATEELFNIGADPCEKEELSAKHPEKLKELAARLDAYAQQALPPSSKPGTDP